MTEDPNTDLRPDTKAHTHDASSEHARPPSDVEQLCINTIRTLAMDAVQKANSGHPGTPMGLAPLAYLLWTKYLKHNPRDPAWPEQGPLRAVGRPRFDAALRAAATSPATT